MPTWNPATMPRLGLVDGYDETDDEALISFDTERGPPRLRKVVSDPGYLVQAQTTPMTLAQRNALLTFYRMDCNRGAATFTMNDPIDGIAKTWMFESRPAIRLSGNYFVASLSLRKMPG